MADLAAAAPDCQEFMPEQWAPPRGSPENKDVLSTHQITVFQEK